jgi:hypothetical protein
MDRQLDRAVTAVNAALTALRRDPCSPGVAAALRQGGDAVAQLPTNLTAVVLRRLIIAATDCHHDGVAHSARLAVCLRSASIALRLDPRWADTELHTHPQPDPSRPYQLSAEADHGAGDPTCVLPSMTA